MCVRNVSFDLKFSFQLKELIEEYDDGEADEAGAGPENRHLRIENKNFYFTCKTNAQVSLTF